MSETKETAFSEGLLAYEEACKLAKEIHALEVRRSEVTLRYNNARSQLTSQERRNQFDNKTAALYKKVFG